MITVSEAVNETGIRLDLNKGEILYIVDIALWRKVTPLIILQTPAQKLEKNCSMT